MGEDGTNIGRQKIQALRDNSNYFRMRLEEMGLQVLGRYDSPVMPIMLYNPTKISAFSRECFKRGVAVVKEYIKFVISIEIKIVKKFCHLLIGG